MSPAWLSVQFVLCAVIIVRAGVLLSQTADRLSTLLGWSRGWIGLGLVAAITSLPELASGVSAVAWLNAPNLAAGTALGASIVNLALLALVDGLHRRASLYAVAGTAHRETALYVVAMAGLTLAAVLAGEAVPTVAAVSLASPLLLALYLIALRRAARHVEGEASGPVGRDAGQARAEWLRLIAAGVLVVGVGAWFASVADALAQSQGLSRTAVGTVLMAVVTTLPELAVTFGAVRIGAYELAIGNLLGSCLFNLALLAVDDLAWRNGVLFEALEPGHAGSATALMLMAGLVAAALTWRPRARRHGPLSWVSVALLAVYVVNALRLLEGSGQG